MIKLVGFNISGIPTHGNHNASADPRPNGEDQQNEEQKERRQGKADQDETVQRRKGPKATL